MITLLCLAFTLPALGQPSSFGQAKELLREQVYYDQNESAEGSFYCGCHWSWVGDSGGRVDAASCGYQVRKQETRAARIEWEHVVPAWVMGHQRQCWQEGGRRNCAANDPLFEIMEADMHNLTPTIGEVNGDRSNYSFGELPAQPSQYGQCDTQVAFGERTVEPRDQVKGQIARTYFYIHDRYNLTMSRQQQQLFMAWHRLYPVTDWERERDRRIAAVMGHNNPFVTGERAWSLGHRNVAAGIAANEPTVLASADPVTIQLRGNRNSRVYHLQGLCPSYDRVAPENRVEFNSVSEAEAAGYRRAGNCRS
nr:endonuclease [Marinobacter zhejiangensis]